MTDAAAVRRALGDLAARREAYRAAIARADRAAADVETAAAVFGQRELDRLGDAVAAAERRGDREAARAGRRALRAVERYRDVAGRATGRGTVLPGDCEPAGE